MLCRLTLLKGELSSCTYSTPDFTLFTFYVLLRECHLSFDILVLILPDALILKGQKLIELNSFHAKIVARNEAA